MKIDVLSLITPDPAIIATQGLQGSTPSWTYLSAPDANGLQQLVYIKGKTGYPWDWLTVGQQYIYQLLTENVWGDPSTGKLMFGLGSPRLPRFIDYSPNQPPGVWSFTVERPQTDYVIYGPGGIPTGRNTDNFVRNSIKGPFLGAAIGDLPAGQDWWLDYEWGGKGDGVYGTLERITVREGVGRYAWAAYAWRSDGDYSQASPLLINGKVQLSQTTKILIQPCPVPVQKIF